jgi:signal transduction histidine kinase
VTRCGLDPPRALEVDPSSLTLVTVILVGAAAACVLVVALTGGPPDPVPVRLGVLGAAAATVLLQVVRARSWGLGSRLPEDLLLLATTVVPVLGGVAVAAARTVRSRARLRAAAARLGSLALAPLPSSPVVAEADTLLGAPLPGATALDAVLVDHVRRAREVAIRREEVRRSQQRVVEAGDRERLRIERDLHDGAQQRLVAASFALSLAHRDLAQKGPIADVARVRHARTEVRLALEELRAVSHGAFPRLLTSAGLTAALHALAETAPNPVRVETSETVAPSQPLAVTVYAVAARLAVAEAGPVDLTVSADAAVVRVVARCEPTAEVTATLLGEGVRDRVEALGGRLVVHDEGSRARVEVVLPCES